MASLASSPQFRFNIGGKRRTSRRSIAVRFSLSDGGDASLRSSSSYPSRNLHASSSDGNVKMGFNPNDEVLSGSDLISSAMAAATAILKVSPSPVEFDQRIERVNDGMGLGQMPSQEFLRICEEQLEIFRRIVHLEAVLSVYVRPAGSYAMDQLELRRIFVNSRRRLFESRDVVILNVTFSMPSSMKAVESALLRQPVDDVSRCGSMVLPMVKDPFLLGLLVIELPEVSGTPVEEQAYDLDPHALSFQEYDESSSEIQIKHLDITTGCPFNMTSEQRAGAINISRSLAAAYVMDQKALLLQQSSWQTASE